ncbi:MAG: sporulation membrane protein YtaF [Desulfurispora sp.]|uniref:sporulation membrane protein YtaF n=1 Tax=Desulfurispora sp. TaxID=3014275 RepID=UPI00404B840E
MEYFTLLFFALALNMDAFTVGIAYGMRRIRLPLTSLLIISLMSVGAISISMLAGQLVTRFIPAALTHKLGGIILLLIGCWALYQYHCQKKTCPHPAEPPGNCPRSTAPGPESGSAPVKLLQMRFLGLLIQVLKEPQIADRDLSGVISSREALLLGLALSMDALTAGLAVSLIGFRLAPTAVCVGAGHILLTSAGMMLGRGLSSSSLGRQLAALPGILLILLGISKLH